MSVPRVQVGDVLELHRRAVALLPEASYNEIGIRSFGRGVFLKDPVTGAELGTKKVYEIHPGDLLLSNVFAWEGAVAVAGPETAGRIGSHRFMTWTPVSDEVDINYLAQLFVSEQGLEMIGRASPGSAGRNRTLGIKNFENLVIPVPDLAEQRRIAARLDRVADLATATTRTSMTTIRALVSKQMLDAPERPLGAILRLTRDEFNVDDSATYERAGVLGFGRGLFSHGPLVGTGTKYQKLRRIHAGDVVLSRLKAFEGAIAMAEPVFDQSVVSQEFETFRPTDDIDLAWLDALTKAEWFWQRMQAATTGMGARRERLHAQRFLDLQVPVPTAARQARLGQLNNRVRAMARLVNRRNAQGSALLPAVRNDEFAKLI